MPVHDWSRVDAGIFHAFHHSWIEEIARALNKGVLPGDYYALPEQHAARFGPDVLTLQGRHVENEDQESASASGGIALAPTRLKPVAESDLAFYRRKQKHIAVRHVSGDDLVAIIELVSPGNKSGRGTIRAFIEKAADLIEMRIHLLIVDLHPPGRRDPHGIHDQIWKELTEERQALPPGKPLSAVSYECGVSLRAYAEYFAHNEPLPDMPLFLEAGLSVEVPLEATYNSAFSNLLGRWQSVLDAP